MEGGRMIFGVCCLSISLSAAQFPNCYTTFFIQVSMGSGVQRKHDNEDAEPGGDHWDGVWPAVAMMEKLKQASRRKRDSRKRWPSLIAGVRYYTAIPWAVSKRIHLVLQRRKNSNSGSKKGLDISAEAKARQPLIHNELQAARGTHPPPCFKFPQVEGLPSVHLRIRLGALLADTGS